MQILPSTVWYLKTIIQPIRRIPFFIIKIKFKLKQDQKLERYCFQYKILSLQKKFAKKIKQETIYSKMFNENLQIFLKKK
ncbi:unnamed protein product [Paramecium sonneborni]|uniref:Uncharacterized protein n=1 Tax=Paramecium sonneborni TaxID=65129 RepID=A0A8S1NKF2_9CILI|nr:unnamed protein product [Paramecium sonneborni]